MEKKKDCIDRALDSIKNHKALQGRTFLELPNPQLFLDMILECVPSIPDGPNSEPDEQEQIDQLHLPNPSPSKGDLAAFIINAGGSVTINKWFDPEVMEGVYELPLSKKQSRCRQMIELAADLVSMSGEPVTITIV